MQKSDSNAILYKKDKFEEVRRFHTSLHLVEGQNYNRTDKLSEEMYYPSMGLFVLLRRKRADSDHDEESKEGQDLILVVNTHILFNKNRGHVKFGMLVLLFKIMNEIKVKYNYGSTILCGDFNIAPNSMLYNYIATGHVHLGVDLKEFSNQAYLMYLASNKPLDELISISDMKYKPRPNPKVTISQIFLQNLNACQIKMPTDPKDITITFENHFTQDIKINVAHTIRVAMEELSSNLHLKSSYAKFNKKFFQTFSSKPSFNDLHFWFNPNTHNNDSFISNFTDDVRHTVDYVWYNSSQFHVARVLQCPDPQYLAQSQSGSPFDFFPSDHFSLVVDFVDK